MAGIVGRACPEKPGSGTSTGTLLAESQTTLPALGDMTNYTQRAYTTPATAVFVELPAFERHRAQYLDDEAFTAFQYLLMRNPGAGDLIQETGGLRKIRFADARRGKGKRGGLRVVYYWWEPGAQFWLFTLFAKDEMSDLRPQDRRALKAMVKAELEARRNV